MDDLQDLLEVALENAEDLHKELVKAIEAGEERATNQIEYGLFHFICLFNCPSS